MKRLFSKIKLEPGRASVALFKTDSTASLTEKNRKTGMFDTLQQMIKEHDKQKIAQASTVWGHFPSDPEEIPEFLFSAMDYLERHGLETVGIFRHSTSKSREDKVMQEIDEKFRAGGAKNATVNFEEYHDIHLAASLIKVYLRKLNEPLLTNKLYESFLATSKMTSPRCSDAGETANLSATEIEEAENNRKIRLLQQVVSLLPIANYCLLKRLCLFLNKITKFQSQNLMSPENIAIVFQPNVLYLKDQDPMLTIRDISNATNVIKSLIVFAPEIFGEQEQATPRTRLTTEPSDSDSSTLDTSSLVSEILSSTTDATTTTAALQAVTSPLTSPRSSSSNNSVNTTSTSTVPSIALQRTPSASSMHLDVSACGGDQTPEILQEGQPFYKGETNSKGEKHGYGILMFHDGSVFEGNFIDDKKEGHGKMVWADGSKYEGEFSNDTITGRGTYKYASGDHYDGHFVNGLREGKGKIKFASNQSHYEGEWLQDKRHGFGKQSYANGDVYEGEWKQDFSSGYGTFTSEGYTYEGYWKSGKFDGKGKFILFIDSNRREILEGEWLDGQLHGELHYTDGEGRKFLQTYEKGELVKNDRLIDEKEQRVLDLVQKLMLEPIKSHPQIKFILEKQVIQHHQDASSPVIPHPSIDVAIDHQQEQLRNALYKVLTTPETTIVFDLLCSLVELIPNTFSTTATIAASNIQFTQELM